LFAIEQTATFGTGYANYGEFYGNAAGLGMEIDGFSGCR